MGHTAAILTVSDGVAAGWRSDDSGDALEETLVEAGFELAERRVVADEADDIATTLRELAGRTALVVTTGGTGFGPRDVTPEATRAVLEREAPGLVAAMLAAGLASTPMAALTRAAAGTVGSALVINLPGSPRGATENLAAILGVIPHALELLAGDTEHRHGTPPPA